MAEGYFQVMQHVQQAPESSIFWHNYSTRLVCDAPCYVRHVDTSDLPPFIRAVLQVNSFTRYQRHGRITSNRQQDDDDLKYWNF